MSQIPDDVEPLTVAEIEKLIGEQVIYIAQLRKALSMRQRIKEQEEKDGETRTRQS